MMDDANASAVNCSKRSNVSFLPEPCENRTDLAGIIKIASGLSVTPCFYYSLAFLLFPLFFYSYEWYRTQSKNLHDKVNQDPKLEKKIVKSFHNPNLSACHVDERL